MWLSPPRDGPGDRDRTVTSSLMSVSTAAFSDSLRQMPARGLSLLLMLGHLSMEHSPGLSWGNYPAGMLGGSFHPPPILSASAHVLHFPFCTHRCAHIQLPLSHGWFKNIPGLEGLCWL